MFISSSLNVLEQVVIIIVFQEIPSLGCLQYFHKASLKEVNKVTWCSAECKTELPAYNRSKRARVEFQVFNKLPFI